MSDNINPDYYRKGIETTDYIQSHSMNYLEGNIIKLDKLIKQQENEDE